MLTNFRDFDVIGGSTFAHFRWLCTLPFLSRSLWPEKQVRLQKRLPVYVMLHAYTTEYGLNWHFQ